MIYHLKIDNQQQGCGLDPGSALNLAKQTIQITEENQQVAQMCSIMFTNGKIVPNAARIITNVKDGRGWMTSMTVRIISGPAI